MREKYITEWIYKRRKSQAKQVPIRMPKTLELEKGDYIIKLYKLIPEERVVE